MQWHIVSNNFFFSLKHKQFFALQFLAFSLFSFDSSNEVDFSFLHCRHVDFDFVTTPCCFQASRILCWGTEPPTIPAKSSWDTWAVSRIPLPP